MRVGGLALDLLCGAEDEFEEARKSREYVLPPLQIAAIRAQRVLEDRKSVV